MSDNVNITYELKTLSDVGAEIVKRSDEDFNNSYYIERAISHFFSAIYKLLSARDDNLGVYSEEDIRGLVDILELDLNTNCKYINSEVSIEPFNCLSILGGFCSGNFLGRQVRVVDNIVKFNEICNVGVHAFGNVMYIYKDRNELLVYPYFTNSHIKYIKDLQEVDIFSSLSGRFIHLCLDLAVNGFKNEVTLNESK